MHPQTSISSPAKRDSSPAKRIVNSSSTGSHSKDRAPSNSYAKRDPSILGAGEKKVGAGDQSRERGELQDVFAKLHRKTAALETERGSELELAEAGAEKSMSVCLPAFPCLSACLPSVCLPACPLSVYLPALCLSALCLSTCLPSVCLPACPLSVYLPALCLSTCLPSVCLPACPLSVYLPALCLSTCLPSVCLPACPLSVYLPALCLSPCLSLSVCLFIRQCVCL